MSDNDDGIDFEMPIGNGMTIDTDGDIGINIGGGMTMDITDNDDDGNDIGFGGIEF